MHLGAEWNRRDLAGSSVQTPQLPALGYENALAVAGPVISGQHAERLRTARDQRLDRIHGQPLGAGFHVADPERRARTVLVALVLEQPVGNWSCEGEPPAVGR